MAVAHPVRPIVQRLIGVFYKEVPPPAAPQRHPIRGRHDHVRLVADSLRRASATFEQAIQAASPIR